MLSGTELGNGGISTNNEPDQTGDESSPIINGNITDGSGLVNTPSSSSGIPTTAAGESGNQIVSDSSTTGKIK